jgi:hypothetical protein
MTEPKGGFLDYFKEKAYKKGGAARQRLVSWRVPHEVGERLCLSFVYVKFTK